MRNDSSRPGPDPKIEINVSKKAKESTEMDLWDIDLGEEVIPSPSEKVQRAPGQLPVQRKSVSKIKTKKPSDPKPKSAEAAELTGLEPVSEELGELEPISEEPAESGKDQAAETPSREAPVESEDDIFDGFPDLEQEMPIELENRTKQWEEADDVSTEKPEQKPMPVISAIGSMSKIEKIAISALVAVLVLSAILTLIHFSNRVPTRPLVAEEVDFPVSGKIVEIIAAGTYWREPVTTGENADVVRRGTQLIPVLKLNLSSKSGAIRVFFRNEDGLVMGDGITRTVKGDAEVTVAATAGFEDVGMHTAYRTGDTKRWVVQVFEAPDATSPREKFRKVLEMDISTEIR